MSDRSRGRAFAAPKYRAKMVTKQVMESSQAPDRKSEEMEVENPWVPDRRSEDVGEENPRVHHRKSENHDMEAKLLARS